MHRHVNNSLASGKPQSVTPGSLDSRENHTNGLFCFCSFATVVILIGISPWKQKFKMHKFNNTANGLKMKMRKS